MKPWLFALLLVCGLSSGSAGCTGSSAPAPAGGPAPVQTAEPRTAEPSDGSLDRTMIAADSNAVGVIEVQRLREMNFGPTIWYGLRYLIHLDLQKKPCGETVLRSTDRLVASDGPDGQLLVFAGRSLDPGQTIDCIGQIQGKLTRADIGDVVLFDDQGGVGYLIAEHEGRVVRGTHEAVRRMLGLPPTQSRLDDLAKPELAQHLEAERGDVDRLIELMQLRGDTLIAGAQLSHEPGGLWTFSEESGYVRGSRDALTVHVELLGDHESKSQPIDPTALRTLVKRWVSRFPGSAPETLVGLYDEAKVSRDGARTVVDLTTRDVGTAESVLRDMLEPNLPAAR